MACQIGMTTPTAISRASTCNNTIKLAKFGDSIIDSLMDNNWIQSNQF